VPSAAATAGRFTGAASSPWSSDAAVSRGRFDADDEELLDMLKPVLKRANRSPRPVELWSLVGTIITVTIGGKK